MTPRLARTAPNRDRRPCHRTSETTRAHRRPIGPVDDDPARGHAALFEGQRLRLRPAIGLRFPDPPQLAEWVARHRLTQYSLLYDPTTMVGGLLPRTRDDGSW